jgi:hypothetical protein
MTAHSKRPQRALADKRANVASLTEGANLDPACQQVMTVDAVEADRKA